MLAGDIRAMVATRPFGLRSLRDPAFLLLGYEGGLRPLGDRQP